MSVCRSDAKQVSGLQPFGFKLRYEINGKDSRIPVRLYQDEAWDKRAVPLR